METEWTIWQNKKWTTISGKKEIRICEGNSPLTSIETSTVDWVCVACCKSLKSAIEFFHEYHKY